MLREVVPPATANKKQIGNCRNASENEQNSVLADVVLYLCDYEGNLLTKQMINLSNELNKLNW